MTRKTAAFSLIELILLVAVTALVLAVVLPPFLNPPRRPYRLKCVNNLKNIGLAFRIFATDNDSRYPGSILASNHVPFASIDARSVFLALSNELSTPKILLCTKEQKRKEADSFAKLVPGNISYFASISADETLPAALLSGDRNLQINSVPSRPGQIPLLTNDVISWTKELHEPEGNVAMADGSVQMLNTNRARQVVSQQGLATNYLVFP